MKTFSVLKTATTFYLLFFAWTASANVVGTHLQNFNPTTNGLDFVTVQSTKTLPAGEFNLGVFTNYAFNSLPFYKAAGVPSSHNFSEPNDKLLSADFNLGLGISDAWDVGLSLPMVLDQTIDPTAQLGSYSDTGFTEIRINSKYRLHQQDNWALAVVGSVNFDRIKNSPFTGNDPGPSWNVEAVFDYVIRPGLLWAVNLGYRLHDSGTAIPDSDVIPLSDQILYSSALSYFDERWQTTWIAELFGSIYTDSTSVATNRELHNLEILAGAKHAFTDRLTGHAGITTGVYNGLASPDFRIYLGVNWRLGPVQPLPVAAAPPPAMETITETIITEEMPPSEVIVLSSINFDTSSDEMTPTSRREFQATADRIKNHSQALKKIIVEGHTDGRGTEAYNLALSQRRADSVVRVLKSELGTVAIQGIGKGESRPIASNDTVAGMAKNRRVELKIYR